MNSLQQNQTVFSQSLAKNCAMSETPDNPASSGSTHAHFAGRVPAGTSIPVTVSKNGVRHIRRLENGKEQEILSVGLACSECFSGRRLAKLLKPGFDYEQKAMEDMMRGSFAQPLSIHTSGGVPDALSKFLDALEPHLPWKNVEELDWCTSLQLEGASAVWAAIDMLLQEQALSSGNQRRKMVAVGASSYHGPPSTSFGAKEPLWHKNYQVTYPVPVPGEPVNEEQLLTAFEAFLNKHGEEIGVMLVEPQWGSSQAALVWPKDLLKKYIKMAQACGIRVICDEIMCGLGRHGQGTLFLSEAWDLDPDAVTFGKAIAGGVYPLSGAIVKRGQGVLCMNGKSVMQSHTFAGSSTRALMTATEVLKEIPQWIPSIAKLGEEMTQIFSYLAKLSDGMIIPNGQGLMWGCIFSRHGQNADDEYRNETIRSFKKHCEDVGILPYFIPAGGFMVTPVIDVDVGTVYEIGERLEEAVKRTMNSRNWYSNGDTTLGLKSDKDLCYPITDYMIKADTDTNCLSRLHETRSCTSCTNFVCQEVRRRFQV